MRILIVGAGIGGLTLAALLKQRGFYPQLVEQKKDIFELGYMLTLYPLGSRILYGLGLMDTFLERSVGSDTCVLCKGSGEVIHHFSLKQVFAPWGTNRSCTRGTLLRVLREGPGADIPLRMGMAVSAIEQPGEGVEVAFQDGTREEYDLVVAADGMDSTVRRLLWTPEEIRSFDTGWGGWLWWTDDASLVAGTAMEFWGAGYMLGIYPTEYRFGAFAVLPAEKDKIRPWPGLRSHIRQSMADLIKSRAGVFEQIPEDEQSGMQYWPMRDVRTHSWFKKRVVLLGDAAVGFLPTSDAGASMAMESAAVLADELTRTDLYRMEWALSLYEKRRKPRVEGVQNDARSLARQMFVKSAISSRLRNYMLQRYSLKTLSDNIEKFFQLPI